jgi:putative transposase
MSEKYNDKYRIASARLQSWNYASEGMYFITICTKDRLHYFGEINEGNMDNSILGDVFNDEWEKTPSIRPDMNLGLGEYVVMPNHFHAILIIGKNEYNNGIDGFNCRDVMHDVSTIKTMNQFGPQSKNLASVMRGFKSAVTTYARKNNIEFDWQPRFHDHIIRDHPEYIRISNYIINNPKSWDQDIFNG